MNQCHLQLSKWTKHLNSLQIHKNHGMNLPASYQHTVKQKCSHFDEIVVVSCTKCHQNGNFGHSQWLKCYQNDISISVQYSPLSYGLINSILHIAHLLNKSQQCTSPISHNASFCNRNGRHFADAIFKYIFLNENVWTPIKISLKFVLKGSINNIPATVQIMAWCLDHYLNQWWLVYRCIYASLGLNELIW